MRRVLFLLSLSGSVPTRRTDCSARTAMSSGSIASSLSNVLSKASSSPDSLWIRESDLREDESSGSRAFAIRYESAALSPLSMAWNNSPNSRCSSPFNSRSSAFISASVSIASRRSTSGSSPGRLFASASSASKPGCFSRMALAA